MASNCPTKVNLAYIYFMHKIDNFSLLASLSSSTIFDRYNSLVLLRRKKKKGNWRFTIKKYQRAKEKGNAEEVDPERHTAEKQEEVISKLNQLRNGFGGIDYKQLKQDTLKYYPEGAAKKSILDEIEMDTDLLSLSDSKKEILEGGLLTEPFANKIQRRYKVLQSEDYKDSRTDFLLSQQAAEEEADKETTDGMIGNVVNDATDNQLDNSKVEILKNNEVETNKSTTSVKKKKKKEEEEGLFGSLKSFFS